VFDEIPVHELVAGVIGVAVPVEVVGQCQPAQLELDPLRGQLAGELILRPRHRCAGRAQRQIPVEVGARDVRPLLATRARAGAHHVTVDVAGQTGALVDAAAGDSSPSR